MDLYEVCLFMIFIRPREGAEKEKNLWNFNKS